MNKAITKLIITTLGISLLTLAGAALAQEPGPAHHGDHPHHGDRPHHGERQHHGQSDAALPAVDMMMRAVRRLDLSDEQRDSIRGIMQTLKTEDRRLMREMKSGHEQLRDLIKADTFDEAAVAGVAGKEGALATERLILASRAMSRVYAQLTDAQREQLDTMAEERASRRAEKRKQKTGDV